VRKAPRDTRYVSHMWHTLKMGIRKRLLKLWAFETACTADTKSPTRRKMARTKSGCWTCRLRTKKKCDEAKPVCKRCADLAIHCFGYGSRPSPAELGDDRRALIASVGAASRSANSRFRAWRMTAEPRAWSRFQFETQSNNLMIDSAPEAVSSLVALDRVNSGLLDFLHPRLLSNYTESVFWLNSRFYQSPGLYEGNSWIRTFLTRSPKTHLAAALMGLTYQTVHDDMSRIINIDFTRSLTVLHSIVVQGISDEIEQSRKLDNTAEAVLRVGANLAKCVTLLLIFEVRPFSRPVSSKSRSTSTNSCSLGKRRTRRLTLMNRSGGHWRVIGSLIYAA
jgi:hypothetical protein